MKALVFFRILVLRRLYDVVVTPYTGGKRNGALGTQNHNASDTSATVSWPF